ncbi:WD repeat-containing protein 76 [Dendrobium catenatum]|uniref:WD repeat-containing protein 76 n=1 Tax=Dendrobium catenatum TaxID=906689 RepID=A0A2I0VW48_9ASPA|nr:WD repeat-containing protein 76 [Dendrobium catenatum]PKU67631.1 Protein DAMAGED DNA-BINDING 2 [Dendrobium catenatum]
MNFYYSGSFTLRARSLPFSMATKKTLTDYESQRLENIRRNGEMIASLMLHSKASEVSDFFKRSSSKSTKYAHKIKKQKNSPPRSPLVIRRSLRTRGLPPNHSGYPSTPTDSSPFPPSPKPELSPARKREQIHINDAFLGEIAASDRPLIDVILAAAAAGADVDGGSRSKLLGDYKFDPRSSMVLKPENVGKVLPERILSVQFLPSANRTVVVVGNKLGNVGFWDLDFGMGDGNEDDSGIYVYAPHSASVSGISVHPSSVSKIFTGSYDGLVRKMDVEKETFNVTYSTENCIFSICQWPCDIDSLYIGEGAGDLKHWDERAGKVSSKWGLHEDRINSVDFSPENCYLMATSSTDGTACIWDLRRMKNHQPEQLNVVRHNRAVHSAYFSPTGNYLATTSIDDTVGIINLSHLNDISMVHHYNQTGRWLSSFRAIWGWDDSFLFLGNMRRAVDIISITSKTTTALVSPEMTSIPCRFASHPCQIGTLAGATAGGKVFVWTKS